MKKYQKPNENEISLDSFVKHCKSHPHERFWQALRNWARTRKYAEGIENTFYWK